MRTTTPLLPLNRGLSPSSQVALLVTPLILAAEESDRPTLVGRCHKRLPPRKALYPHRACRTWPLAGQTSVWTTPLLGKGLSVNRV